MMFLLLFTLVRLLGSEVCWRQVKVLLARVWSDLKPPTSGSVRLDGYVANKAEIRQLIRAGIGYIPAERLTQGLIPQFRLSWNVSMASGHDLFAARSGRG